MKSLLLDRTAVDLVLDTSGNIACATSPYAVAQDVACAVRLFKSELWYDTTKGIPYFQEILGQWPPIALIRSYVEKAALTVPEVVQAQCTIVGTSDRTITGRVEVIDQDGITHNVTF